MSHTGWALRRRGPFLLALVLGLVALADWLFYGHAVGWSAGIFGLTLILALTLRGGRYLRSWPGRAVAAATLGMVVALVVHPGALVVTLGLLGLVTLAILDRGGWTSSVAEWGWRWLAFVVRSGPQGASDLLMGCRWLRRHPALWKHAGGLARAALWVVPVMLSAVFVGLFALANPIVERMLEELWDTLFALGAPAPGRVALWVFTAAAAWGLLLRVRLRQKHAAKAPPAPLYPGRLWGWLTPGSTRVGGVVRCLILFNAVFAVQTLLDVGYLYGGAELPDGMTYAQYAHRGAYPLVATALLAGLFVLVTFRPGGAAQQSRLARRLVGLWIAQNIVLTVSAVWRLGLYVQTYSLTRWRLSAALWMALVGVGLGWLVWRIVFDRDNRWLLQRVTLTALALLYTLCFVDLDGRIARYNVAHCREMGGGGQALDVAYPVSYTHLTLPTIYSV